MGARDPARACQALMLAFCALLSVSCAASTRPVIKIALVAPFEGRYRAIGEEVVYAVRLAVREANAAGGVGGYAIELMAYDDAGDEAAAEEQAHKLASDPQVLGVVGHWRNATSLAAAPVYAEADLAYLATTPSPELHPHAFRLWYTAAAYLAADPALAHCPLPCDSLEDLSWLSTQPDAASGAVGPAVWGLSQFVRLLGAPAEDVRVVTPAPLPAHSADASFADRYLAISPGPQPGFHAVLAYDATWVLLTAIGLAIEQSDMPTRSGVAAALSETRFDGLSGQIWFDAEKDWANAHPHVYAWLGGQLVDP